MYGIELTVFTSSKSIKGGGGGLFYVVSSILALHIGVVTGVWKQTYVAREINVYTEWTYLDGVNRNF